VLALVVAALVPRVVMTAALSLERLERCVLRHVPLARAHIDRPGDAGASWSPWMRLPCHGLLCAAEHKNQIHISSPPESTRVCTPLRLKTRSQRTKRASA